MRIRSSATLRWVHSQGVTKIIIKNVPFFAHRKQSHQSRILVNTNVGLPVRRPSKIGDPCRDNLLKLATKTRSFGSTTSFQASSIAMFMSCVPYFSYSVVPLSQPQLSLLHQTKPQHRRTYPHQALIDSRI